MASNISDMTSNITVMESNITVMAGHTRDEVIGLATFTITIIVLAIPANILVLLAYLISRSSRQKPSNYLLVNMTVSELVTAMVAIPLQLSASILNPSLVMGGGVLCTLVGATTYPFYIVSVATMVCISVDRLYAIRCPLIYKTKMTKKRIIGLIAYTWVHGVLFVVVVEFAVGFKHSDESTECGIVWSDLHFSVSIIIAATHIALPFALLMGLNWNLVLCLRRQNRSVEAHFDPQLGVVLDGNRVRKKKSRQAQERKVACMVLWLISTYLICWIPYLVTRILQITPIKTSPLIDTIAALILHLSVVINPVLNLVFRKELRLTIERLFKRNNDIMPSALSPTILSGHAGSRVVATISVGQANSTT